MNLANKITISRIVLAILIILIMLLPYDSFGIAVPVISLSKEVDLSIPMLVSGVLFVIASITDFIDGDLARKRGMVTNLGKMLDAIADKLLVNSSLIILAYFNVVPVIVAVVVVFRDIFVNAIKMQAASKGMVVAAIKSGKVKTAFLMTGIAFAYFSNFPFVYLGYNTVSDALLYVATILSIVSMIEYFNMNKHLFTE